MTDADNSTLPATLSPKAIAISETRVERREFYRNTTHRLFVMVLALVGVCALLIGIIAYLLARGPIIQDYAVTKDLRVLPLTPLDKPLVSNEAVRNWTANSLRKLYNYDFVHYRDQLNSTRSLFTDDKAYSGFVKAVKQSGALATVKARRLVVSSMLSNPPTIVAKGLIDGRASWKLEVPMVIRYDSSSTSSTQNVLIHVLVQRVSQAVNARGLGISQIVAPRS